MIIKLPIKNDMQLVFTFVFDKFFFNLFWILQIQDDLLIQLIFEHIILFNVFFFYCLNHEQFVIFHEFSFPKLLNVLLWIIAFKVFHFHHFKKMNFKKKYHQVNKKYLHTFFKLKVLIFLFKFILLLMCHIFKLHIMNFYFY